jgi:hypothetical protein
MAGRKRHAVPGLDEERAECPSLFPGADGADAERGSAGRLLLFVMIWSPKIMDLVLGSTRLKMERTVLDDGAQGPCMETTRSDSLGAGGAENADARSSCVYVTPALAANSSPAAGRA